MQICCGVSPHSMFTGEGHITIERWIVAIVCSIFLSKQVVAQHSLETSVTAAAHAHRVWRLVVGSLLPTARPSPSLLPSTAASPSRAPPPAASPPARPLASSSSHVGRPSGAALLDPHCMSAEGKDHIMSGDTEGTGSTTTREGRTAA